jgi:UDP-N-acetylmuramoylalanine--D-glutamate ligase
MLRPGAKFFNSENTPRGEYADFPLPGEHNRRNLDFAVALAGVANPRVDNLRGLEHRLEPVPTTDGLRWYNDSKGTTVYAVECALRSFDSNVVLLMGGRDKNLDFSPLDGDINARCIAVVLFGEAADKIHRQLTVKCPIIRAENLGGAVAAARDAASPGATVLLSPGCTSFDEFKSFEERGAAFKAYVTQ